MRRQDWLNKEMRKTIPLNKDWLFRADVGTSYQAGKGTVSTEQYEPVHLPHMVKQLPYNNFDESCYQFISSYIKIFDLELELGQRAFIQFQAVMNIAQVYLNGRFIGRHQGGYTPFQFEISDYLISHGANRLEVVVDSREDPAVPPFGYVIDYLCYGGIYREVEILLTEQNFIEKVFYTPIDVLTENKKLNCQYWINSLNEPDEPDYQVRLALYADNPSDDGETNRQLVAQQIAGGTGFIALEQIANLSLWDLEQPILYRAVLELYDKERLFDRIEQRIGFRSAEFRTDGFYLNGNRVKLSGLNRHQSFPYVGYAMPKRAQQQDAIILKQIGINLVRTSHYPQSVHFLNKCDELGLLVFEEIPGWQHIGDQEWQQLSHRNIEEMIDRDYNHPSIILWGVRINESNDDHCFYVKSNQIAHQLDPSRQTGGVRCITDSELLEDVYTMNDFIYDGQSICLRPQKQVTGLNHDVPYLVTEYGGHIFPTKKFDNEERLAEQADRHLQVQNAMMLDDTISGAIGWCAFDYNTHYQFGSGDRICYHGVMDMFRLPKFAAYAYQSQASTKQQIVLQPLTIWARGEKGLLNSQAGALALTVLTNCDYITIHIGGQSMKFYPNQEQYQGLPHPPILVDNLTEVKGWGEGWFDVEFTGYVQDQAVIQRKYAKNPYACALQAKADDIRLDSGEIDCTRIVIELVDQVGNRCVYASDWVDIKVEGEAELIGPGRVCLIGGSIATWIKTKGHRGQAVVRIANRDFAAEPITIAID